MTTFDNSLPMFWLDAVATKNVSAYTIVRGAPAKVIKDANNTHVNK